MTFTTGSRPSHFSSFASRNRHGRSGSASFSGEALLAPLLNSSGNDLPSHRRAELRALARETNPEMFFEGLIALGRNLSREGRVDYAGALFSSLIGASNDAALTARAQRELDAIEGRGGLAVRAEFLTRNLAREATHPVGLAGMAVAGLAFSSVRVGMLGRLLASPTGGFFTRGIGARLLASSVAFGAEVPAFVFTGRVLNEATGVRQDWTAGALGRDLLANALTLGALKLAGCGATSAYERWAGAASRPMLQGFLQQGGMLTGILAGHHAEAWLGLRPHADGATTLVESLAMLVQFNVAGRLMGGALGPGYEAMQRELHVRSRQLDRSSSSDGGGRPPAWADPLRNLLQSSPSAVPEGPGRVFDPRLTNIILMASSKGEGGGRRTRPGVGSSSDPSPPPTPRLSRRGSRAVITPDSGAPKNPEEVAALESNRTVSGEVESRPSSPDSDAAATHVLVPVSPAPESFEEFGAADTLNGGIPPAPNLPREAVPKGTLFVPAPAPSRPVGIADEATVNAPGTTIWEPNAYLPGGRYRLVRLIGFGGQGDVWEAFDESAAQRTVAIKRLRLNTATMSTQQIEALMRRAERERTISSHLEAPFIVPLYDQVEYEPSLYAQIMRYIPGHDLAAIQERLTSHELKPAGGLESDFLPYQNLTRRLDTFRRILEAVDYMHQRGISHRDLKPANVRVDLDGNVYLMDLGLAKREGEKDGPTRMSIPAKSIAEAHLTQANEWQGTPIYMPPEAWSKRPGTDFRAWDTFSLGVMLFEWVSGRHPFATYGEEPATGEALAPARDRHGRTQYNIHAIMLWGTDKLRESYDPPSFREIRPRETSPLMDELERIARRAFAAKPQDRFPTLRHMIQAIELAPAMAEYRRINADIRADMARIEEEMHAAWEEVNPTFQFSRQKPSLQRPIDELIHRRAAWHQGYDNIENIVLQITRAQPWPEASKLIATVNWQRLLDGGDRMPQPLREQLINRIREYDVAAPEYDVESAHPVASMKMALENPVAVKIFPHEIHSARRVNSHIHLRIIPVVRETEANGRELENFREGEAVISGRLGEIAPRIQLGAGKYVFDFYYPGEIENPKYAPMRVPIEIGLGEVRESILRDRPLDLDFEFVPRDQVPEGMIVIHKGTATVGHDFYHDGRSPLALYSKPKRQISLPTFAMDRHPRLVSEYLAFVQDELGKGNNVARQFIPRIRVKPREDWINPDEEQGDKGQRSFIQEFLLTRREFGTKEAIQRIKAKFTGTVFFWETRMVGKGKARHPQIENPFTDLEELARFRADRAAQKKGNTLRTHVDPNEDPILPDQPIANIDFISAEAFRKWTSQRDGLEYAIQSDEENQKAARSGFSWIFPRGFEDNPIYFNSRNIFETNESRFIQPVGRHPLGEENSRDISLFGTIDHVGNVREFVISRNIHEDIVNLSGGSVYVPYGPFFYPNSRAALTKGDVDLASGAIRLVKRFPKP